MPNSQTYILAGGGTGGHLFPGLAVAQELAARQPQARFVVAGAGRELEAEIIGVCGLEHRAFPCLPSTDLRRRPLRFLWSLHRATRSAAAWLRRENPAAVIGLGGFASAPVVRAAGRLRIPTILLEQNAISGRATRWLSRRAAIVYLAFESAGRTLSRKARRRVVGNPVRAEIAALYRRPPAERCERPVLLVLGGSQGSEPVNAAVCRAAEWLRASLRGWKIVHQTGRRQLDDVRQHYRRFGLEAVVEPFFTDMAAQLRQASLAISRAGGTTLAELACAGCPAVLIPYPHAADNHQAANAGPFAAAGAARVVCERAESDGTARALADELIRLLDAPGVRHRMHEAMYGCARPDAAARVADGIEMLCGSASRTLPLSRPTTVERVAG
ncbi:MAG: undecaprenyldiphospho-muramoylpentapeptide beta-N-acetylglucosaminyltransferase [Planctomycetes bacterium]|nr:undecaprenyldiphospho-muramoylpentapeptide beta-N-acetylglucosaminyltransferase [Planctomycetota bacterium]